MTPEGDEGGKSIMKINLSMQGNELTNSPFTIKMALLSLEQLLRGVFVIAVPPTMGVGTFQEYRRTFVG